MIDKVEMIFMIAIGLLSKVLDPDTYFTKKKKGNKIDGYRKLSLVLSSCRDNSKLLLQIWAEMFMCGYRPRMFPDNKMLGQFHFWSEKYFRHIHSLHIFVNFGSISGSESRLQLFATPWPV